MRGSGARRYRRRRRNLPRTARGTRSSRSRSCLCRACPRSRPRRVRPPAKRSPARRRRAGTAAGCRPAQARIPGQARRHPSSMRLPPRPPTGRGKSSHGAGQACRAAARRESRLPSRSRPSQPKAAVPASRAPSGGPARRRSAAGPAGRRPGPASPGCSRPDPLPTGAVPGRESDRAPGSAAAGCRPGRRYRRGRARPRRPRSVPATRARGLRRAATRTRN